MTVRRRIEVRTLDADVTVARFLDVKILDAANIQEMGDELFALVQNEKRKKIILNFTGVEFLSSAALNKLIMLERMVKNAGGKLRLCNLRPEIFEAFAISRLQLLFEIRADESIAIGELAKAA